MPIREDDQFDTDTSANWDGAGVTIPGASETCLMTEDGLAVHSTPTTGNQIWCRFQFVSFPDGDGGVAISDGSGNGFILQFGFPASDLQTERFVEYDAYTTYAANDSAIVNNLGAFGLEQEIGITWDLADTTVRIWRDVPAGSEPDSIALWDGVGPGVTLDWVVEGQTQAGQNLGMGNWNTGVPIDEFEFFVFGEVGAVATFKPAFFSHSIVRY